MVWSSACQMMILPPSLERRPSPSVLEHSKYFCETPPKALGTDKGFKIGTWKSGMGFNHITQSSTKVPLLKGKEGPQNIMKILVKFSTTHTCYYTWSRALWNAVLLIYLPSGLLIPNCHQNNYLEHNTFTKTFYHLGISWPLRPLHGL